MTPFLTAVWSDLLLISYAVPDEALTPYLALGLEPDRWEGSAWCSLVAFNFERARVLGWSVPYPRSLCDFPEFNLRLYVTQGGQRGVVFVRELAPNPLVCGLAKLLYNEPYTAVPMTSRVTQVGDLRRVRHDFVVDGKPQMVAASARGACRSAARGQLRNVGEGAADGLQPEPLRRRGNGLPGTTPLLADVPCREL